MNTKDTKKLRLTTVEVIQQMNDGGTLEELGNRLREVVRLVNDRGAPGSVTLKFSIKKVNRHQVEITDKITYAEPAIKPEPNIFFATDDGALSRHNIEQLRLNGMIDDYEAEDE